MKTQNQWKRKTSKTMIVLIALFSVSFFSTTHAASKKEVNSNNFNVRNYGAIGAGKNLDIPAIIKAIDAVVKVGGGTVLLPAGTYLSGAIHMQSNGYGCQGCSNS